MDRALATAVFGLGVMGRLHVRKLGMIPGVRLVCAVDPDPASFDRADVPPGAARCRSLEEAPAFEAAVVSTPAATHFGIASALLARGVHCLVEKPVCPGADEARRLVAAARERGLVLASGHSERFNPALAEMTRRAGGFVYAEAERIGPFPERSVDADVIQDLMIHDLDALGAFDPGRAVEIRAVGLKVLTDKADIANARIEFESGAVAMLTASRVSLERRRKFRVFSRNGYFSADLIGKTVKSVNVTGEDGKREIAGDLWEAPQVDALLEQDASFVRACLGGPTPAADASLAVPALELADAIRASMKIPDRRA
jgi:predicted dehydrogenase